MNVKLWQFYCKKQYDAILINYDRSKKNKKTKAIKSA